MRVCKTCNKEFPLTDEYFYRNKSFKCGFEYYCKECRKAYKRERYKINTPAKEVRQVKTKFCPLCETTKPLTAEYWHKKSNTKDGYLEQCKVCRNERQALFRQKRKEAKKRKEHIAAMKEKEEMDKMYAKVMAREQEAAGLDISTLKLYPGQTYKVKIPVREGLKQEEFKGILIQECDNHIVLKGSKGYCECFMKADLLIDHELIGVK